jgi:hypothetical protein
MHIKHIWNKSIIKCKILLWMNFYLFIYICFICVLDTHHPCPNQCYMLNIYVLVCFQLGLLDTLVVIRWFCFLIIFFFNYLVPYKLLCSMVHQRFMRYNIFKYCKFFCWYFAQFNGIKFSRYFKFGFLILPTNCLLDDVVQYYYFLHCSLYGFLVLNIWWPPSLYIVMNVNYSHGEKKFLSKFVILTFCLAPTRLNMLFYLSLNSHNSLFLFLDFFKV